MSFPVEATLNYHQSTTLVEALDCNGEQAYRYSDGTDYIYLEKFRVLRHTEHGFWIQDYNDEKFILYNKPKGRRYAYLDKADALDSYKRRKQWQIKICEAAINKAKWALARAEALK